MKTEIEQYRGFRIFQEVSPLWGIYYNAVGPSVYTTRDYNRIQNLREHIDSWIKKNIADNKIWVNI